MDEQDIMLEDCGTEDNNDVITAFELALLAITGKRILKEAHDIESAARIVGETRRTLFEAYETVRSICHPAADDVE